MPSDLPWVSLYWVFTVVTLMMILVLFVVRLPKVELKEDEKAGAASSYRELLKDRYVWLFFFGIFAYVGTEQGVANWVSRFLETYHGLDPQVEGARVVSYFWGLLTAGCLLGLVLLKLIDARKVLVWFSAAAMISLGIALLGSTRRLLHRLHDGRLLPVGHVVGDLLVGAEFGRRAPWLVLRNPVHRHRRRRGGVGAGGLVGRPLRPSGRHDRSLRESSRYILSIGFWAKPLIDNATVSPAELWRSLTGRKAS